LALILLPPLVLVGLEICQITKKCPAAQESQGRVDHTIEVMTTAQALGRAMRESERGQRDLRITGDDANLDLYGAGVQQVPTLFSALKRLTADNPEQQRRWPDLVHQIEIKPTRLKRSIDARQREGSAAARQIV
jgi:CHASE3 domain sensor protein